MLKERLEKHVLQYNMDHKLFLFKEEKDLLEVTNDYEILEETTSSNRFQEAYIERVDKNTEEVIEENVSERFLSEPIQFFKTHKNEFLYVESDWFDIVLTDSISFEVDDLFGTYSVMFGLKLQKKFEPTLRDFLASHIEGDESKYGLLFNQGDGLWDVNFSLNGLEGFSENMSLREAFHLIYRFLFKLVSIAEARK